MGTRIDGILVQTVPELVSVLALEESEQVSPPPAPAVTKDLPSYLHVLVVLLFVCSFSVRNQL